MSKLLGKGGCPPAALGGLATWQPGRPSRTETREMVEVLDKAGRVEDLLPPGHPLLKEYEAAGFTLKTVQVKTDERGRCVR